MSALTDTLLTEFARATDDEPEKIKEYTVYAKVNSVSADGSAQILIDGSEIPTNCKAAVTVKKDDRVLVTIKNRQATITSNLSAPTINPDFLVGGDAVFSGTLQAAKGTFTGSLSAASGSFKGSLDGATGTYSGSVTASSFAAKNNIQLYDGASNRYHVALQFGANLGGYAVDGLTINPGNGFSNGIIIDSAAIINSALVVVGTIQSHTGMYSPAFINTSDERVKHGIKDSKVNNALDRIKEIKHREFYWDENNVYVPIGYIAQELEKIDSGMVSIMPNGMYGVNSTYIISLLTKAVQELSDKVDELERRLENVESEHN